MNGDSKTFKLYVGGLSQQTQNKDLFGLFSKFGGVVEAVVMTGKCFGFVHMEREEDGLAALQKLNGYILHGRPIHVEAALNTKRPVIQHSHRNIVGKRVSNLDDFNDSSSSRSSPLLTPPSSGPATSQNQSPASSLRTRSPITFSNVASKAPGEVSSQATFAQVSSSDPAVNGHASYSRIISRPAEIPATSNSSFINANADYLEPSANKSGVDMSLCESCGEEFNNVFRIPKILSCRHTFCSDCLNSIASRTEVKCPKNCIHFTSLMDAGIAGLTTNNTVKIKTLDSGSNTDLVNSIRSVLTPPLPPPVVPILCLTCFRTNCESECKPQGHQVFPEDQAIIILRERLKHEWTSAYQQLNETTKIRKKIRNRITYTEWALKKFKDELKQKVEDQELDEAMLNSFCLELEKTSNNNVDCSLMQLWGNIEKVRILNQEISVEYKKCKALSAIMNCAKAMILKLDPVQVESILSEWGFGPDEAFPLEKSLEEHVNSGNYANVLLMYMISDLLTSRMHSSSKSANSFNIMPPPPPPQPMPTDASIFSSLQHCIDMHPSSSSSMTNHSVAAGIEHVLHTSIEPGEGLNGSLGADGLLSGQPMVSSPLSLGLSNLSLIARDAEKLIEDSSDEADQKVSDGFQKPGSYLDAAKKPAKQDTVAAKTAISSTQLVGRGGKLPHCWMLISVGGVNRGRVVFQLRPDKAPRMVENFIGLCEGKAGYGYKGTHFFKSKEGFLVGGDVENDNGTGGYSIFDKKLFEADLCPLKDEVGAIRFRGSSTSENRRGMIGSQFMIWYAERDFKKFAYSLVFGKVVEGLDIITQVGSVAIGNHEVIIQDCGLI